MITLIACLFSSLHRIWRLLVGVSVWTEEYGICIESAHFSLGLRVWGSEVLHVSGYLRYRVSLLFFFYCPTCEEEYMSDFFVLMS